MKDKIAQLMKSEGLTSSRFAEILEIQPSGVSHLVSGRNKPGFDLLQKILRRFPKINPYWLLLDDEHMYKRTEPKPVDEPAEVSSVVVDHSINNRDLSSVADPIPTPAPIVNVLPSPPMEPVVDILPPKPEIVESIKSSKIDQIQPKLQRVILLYDDGSFETYTLK